MPTNLPPPRAKAKRSVFTVALNAFMLGSALILAAAVVLQEERYAMGRPDVAGVTGTFTQPVPIDMTSQTMALPPLN
ncbi:MAG: hypothetical protein WAM62_13170 [Pseudolabrys sp.]